MDCFGKAQKLKAKFRITQKGLVFLQL